MNPDRISENFCFYLDPCRRAVLSLPDPAAMQRYPFRILLLWILCGSLPPCSAIPSGSLPPCSAVLPDHAAVDPVRIPAGVQCYPFRILLLCSAVLLDHAAVDPVRILAAVQCYPFRILPLWILCGSLPPCSAVLLDHAAVDPVRILQPCSAIPSGSCSRAALSLPDPAAVQRCSFRILQPFVLTLFHAVPSLLH